MIVICHHCAFVYFLNARRRCPLCGTPARLTGYPLVRDWPDKRLVDRERAPAVDLVMERLFGSMYRAAEYPMICAAASVVNLAGRVRDPAVDYLKALKFGVSLPSSVSWKWTPTYEGASRLEFNSTIDDAEGRVNTAVQMLDVPLGYTFLAPKRKQKFFFKTLSTNKQSGTFGCIETSVHAQHRLGQGHQGPHDWGSIGGKIQLSKPNQPSWNGLDFSSVMMTVDLIDVRYMGDFMVPPSMFFAKNLARHMVFKTRHDVQVSLRAEKVNVGMNWGPLNLSCELGGSADMNMTLVDEPAPENTNHRVVARGNGDLELKKVGGYNLPAWGFFRRKVNIIGTKGPSQRVTWKIEQPAPKPSAPDKFLDFIAEHGPGI